MAKGERKKKLVIVESPTKARTLGKFLGSSYAVRPSVGHIRDLPANRLGVDVENDFQPRYVIPESKKEVVRTLRAEARAASEVILATDPDREGEAISWHIVEALNLREKPVRRVEFHEITRDAILAAFRHPRGINRDLVDAQQARRILDRLVGYKISPLLRRKITKKGLSAGRVQSAAVRLTVDREREIEAFRVNEYWTLEADLRKPGVSGGPRRGQPDPEFRATLHQVRGERAELRTEEQAERMRRELEGARYVVADVRRRELTRNPAAPFTTSTLQQEASRKLGFSARRTMAVAQQLYEGVALGAQGSVGLITYMRTDSTNLAPSAVEEIRAYIARLYPRECLPEEPRAYRARSRNAQEAHEAVRPTSVDRTPDAVKGHLTADQLRLYRLIWQRTVACQMASALLDTTSVDIAGVVGSAAPGAAAEPSALDRTYLFRATGSVVRFQGFMAVYVEGRDDGDAPEEEGVDLRRALPELDPDERLDVVGLAAEQHFTEPPPRYTEATLVKALEEYGIGRPSTYAPILSTIQERGYVERAEKRLQPTELGKLVNDLLVQHFPEIVDVNFTSDMEGKLDEIAGGNGTDGAEKPLWVTVLLDFYGPFERTLEKADQEMVQVELAPEPTDEICEQCGRPMVIKYGRFGKFIACTGYPECRNAKSLMTRIDVLCPRCGGEVVEKRTRRKRLFYSCANWKPNDPEACAYADWNRPAACPTCRTAMHPAGKDDAACPRCHPEMVTSETPTEPHPALTA